MIHGKDIIIYEGDENPVAIAASKSCTIDKVAGTIETSSPASGTARSYASGRTDWVATLNNMVLSVKDYMLRVGETYYLTIGVRGSSTDTISGYAICTECNVTGTVGNLAQGSFRFQGSDREGTIPPQPGETGYDMTEDQVTAIVYNVVGDGYLSRLHNDTAQGLITFNAGAYIPSGQYLRIGDAYLTYDAEYGMLKVWDGSGVVERGLYATGSVSALGAASGGGGGGGGGGDMDRDSMFAILSGAPAQASEWINAKFLKLGPGLAASNDGTLTITGAVTSVGLTMPTGFTVSGSPVTSSGVLAVSLATGYKLLTSSTATPGTYTKVTVDTYGRVTAGSTLAKADIPSLDYIPITGSDSIRGKLEPLTSASYDLGSTDYRWRHGYFSGTVYATTFSGNATTATTASKLGSSTVGGGKNPIYLSSGTPTESSSTEGSSTRPVYLNSGTITQCGTSLAVDITGNAASATKLATARTLWGQSFNGTANVSGDMSDVGNIIPAANKIYSIGSQGNYWGNIYSTYLYLYNEGTTSEDVYSNIYMGNKDTTTGNTAYARLRMFNDHNSNNNGLFAAWSSGDAVFGGGEGVLALANLVRGTNTGSYEYTYIAADGAIWFDVNCGANSNAATARLGYCLTRNGNLVPTSVDEFQNNAGQLGTSTYRWNYLYVNHVNAGGNILAAGAVTALSDIRKKSVITEVNTRIEDIAKLPAFYYKWKFGIDDDMHIGTSAQAVQKIFPELVLGSEELSVDYGVLGTTIGILLCKRILELGQKVKDLEERIEELKN